MKRVPVLFGALLLILLGVYFSYALAAGYLPVSFPEPLNFVAGGTLMLLVLFAACQLMRNPS